MESGTALANFNSVARHNQSVCPTATLQKAGKECRKKGTAIYGPNDQNRKRHFGDTGSSLPRIHLEVHATGATSHYAYPHT